MHKQILGGIAIIAITGIAVWNVNLSTNSNDLSTISLANIEALAEESGIANCPGGSCSYSNNFGASCSVCCPRGKNPRCNSWGCECSGR
jgi:hypothetical protein